MKRLVLLILVAGAGIVAGVIYLAGGEPTLSHAAVATRIEMTKATTDGKTVGDILRERGVANIIWTIHDGDWRGFEGKAFASCFLKDGNAEIYAWQWDAAWSHALALTPKTAKTFPLMDPGVELTPYGQSSLWGGKGAIDRYFMKQ
jgi:hypothetical protein